jgi:hypothetical protein
MADETILYVAPVAALILPALLGGWLARRTGRMRPAWWLALAFGAVALAVFGWATRQGTTTSDSLPGVLLASFVLAPAAFSALIGGAIGRAMR